MKLRSVIGNTLWALACQPAQRRLAHALQQPAEAQQRVLKRLIKKHAASVFGCKHGFAHLHQVSDFQAHVPIHDYESLFPYIERAEAGEPDVLACGSIRAFERTSGSSSAAKFIPCTADSMAEIYEAVSAWMGDLFCRYPSLLAGPSWWIISALQPASTTSGGIRIGLDSDLDYLSAWERALARWVFVQTPALRDLKTSLAEVAAALKNETDLRLISVWNPSLLLLLHQHIGQAWPKLAVISCWADAWASDDAEKLRQRFPHVAVQPKGLLATEGVITLPWSDSAVPALNSHFLEFLDAQGHAHLVHELQQGAEYEVLLSTGAGLWRYRLGDKVRVTGQVKQTPTLQFIGRADGCCDLRGEKLHPDFVAESLKLWQPNFAMLAPIASRDGYALYTEADITSEQIEARLSLNPHYAHCRRLGQLQAVKVIAMTKAEYLDRCLQAGLTVSTVKTSSLTPRPLS
jgi:hypothetical protein